MKISKNVPVATLVKLRSIDQLKVRIQTWEGLASVSQCLVADYTLHTTVQDVFTKCQGDLAPSASCLNPLPGFFESPGGLRV